MLIEYPQIWRRRAVDDSLIIPSQVKQWLRRFDRTLLMRQAFQSDRPLRAFGIHSGPGDVGMEEATVASYDELPSAQFAAVVPEPIYASCTHAKHDPCCAKFGRPVHCALEKMVGDRAWECSHVGGDRFAGNVVVFPWGLYYGRVTPEDAPKIVAATQRREIYLPLYRGRSCFTRPEQVADFFARAETGALEIEAVRPIRTDGSRVELSIGLDTAVVEYRNVSGVFEERLTCHAEEPKPVHQYELVSFEISRGDRAGLLPSR